MKKRKKLSLFKKSLIIYTSILIILSSLVLLYVRKSLVLYENNQLNVFINNYVEKLTSYAKDNTLTKHLNIKNIETSDLEKDKISINKGYYLLLKNSKITYAKKYIKNSKDDTYIIYANLQPVFEVDIKEVKEVKKIGLLNFSILKIENTKINTKDGLYYCDITVPSNFIVLVNGHKLTNKYIIKTENNNEISEEKYNVIPTIVTYRANKLLREPTIKILNNNNEEISYKKTNNTITSNDFYKITNESEASKKIDSYPDVLSFAKDWSLFLTNDLGGTTRGFESLKTSFVKNSNMWKKAYTWATGIDITFVSKHSFKSPAFTNEKVSDYIIYNDKSFSCIVYLEKNMIVAGKTKVDIMSDRLYFIYYDDTTDGINNPSWKLINMKTINNN